eukprot:11871914-Ditylum_brightwellii.AAC.1
MNMYVTLWSTFDKKVKILIQSKVEQHSRDSIALFYYTLQKFTGSTESIIQDQLQQLNGLAAKFKSFQYNVSTFCNYITNCVRTLEPAGGKDNQAPEKFVEALTISLSN